MKTYIKIAYAIAVILTALFLYFWIAKEFGKHKARVSELEKIERTDKRAIDSISSHLRKALLRNELIAQQLEIMQQKQKEALGQAIIYQAQYNALKNSHAKRYNDVQLDSAISAIR